MTYTHLTTNELVMIEAHYQENIKVSDIANALERSKQTIYTVINYLKEGHSAYDCYNRYKVNKKRCGRNKTSLTQSEKDFIQTHLEQNWSLDVIKGAYPDRISCSMRTLYRLADRGILNRPQFPFSTLVSNETSDLFVWPCGHTIPVLRLQNNHFDIVLTLLKW